MKKTLLIANILMGFFLLSCKKENNFQDFSKTAHNSNSKLDNLVSLTAVEPNGTGIDQLLGLEFYLQVKDSYFGNNVLTSNGKDAEVLLQPLLKNNTSQLFYIKKNPSPEIPYLIFSYKENTPIAGRSFLANLRPLLYTEKTENPPNYNNSLAWNFILNESLNGYYIENQTPYRDGKFVLTAISGSPSIGQIDFLPNSGSLNQQFNIIPNDDFIIESLDFPNEGASITSSSPLVLRDGSVSNGGSNPLTRTLQFSETETDQNSFTESNGVQAKVSGGVNVGVKLWGVLDIEGNFNLERGTNKTITYGNTYTSTITIAETFNITVPAYTTSSYRFFVTKHTIRAPYILKCRGARTGKIFNIYGYWDGVDYTSVKLEVTETPISKSNTNILNKYVLESKK